MNDLIRVLRQIDAELRGWAAQEKEAEAVTYAGWVASGELPPSTVELPAVAATDAGLEWEADGGRQYLERGRVEVWAYRALILDRPGDALFGGPDGDGVLEIAERCAAYLIGRTSDWWGDDTDLRLDRLSASQPVVQQGDRWLQRVALTLSWTRAGVEIGEGG